MAGLFSAGGIAASMLCFLIFTACRTNEVVDACWSEIDRPSSTWKIPGERMKMHLWNPQCASCHSLFERIGLSLENFDGIGAWRLKDEGQPIDATGVLANGTKIDGVASLRDVLMQNSEQFVRVIAERLLTYALGRGVEYRDMPLVRSITRDAAGGNYRFSSLVLGVIKSAPFQNNVKGAETAETSQRAAR
jgi:hypothetical protein